MTECKYNYDDTCVNSNCPCCSDYCPVSGEYEGICKFREDKIMTNKLKTCPFCTKDQDNEELGCFDIRCENRFYELYGYDRYGDDWSEIIKYCPMCGRRLEGK